MPVLKMIVNGEPVTLEVDGAFTLLDVLRENLNLKGTKTGCREGECGSCTVLLDGLAVNSCLVPAMKTQGCAVLTIEGLGTVDSPHPLQKAIAETGGVQCGYCTPGFVMSAAALLKNYPQPTEDEVKRGIAGNLCRCTGYKRIVEGVMQAAEKMRKE